MGEVENEQKREVGNEQKGGCGSWVAIQEKRISVLFADSLFR
jgi:hypothetical protein